MALELWGFSLCKIISEQALAELWKVGISGIPLPDPRGVKFRVGIESTEKKDFWTQESSSADRLKNT